ncbi:MAG: hypothetical protein LBO00_06350 [Zoogloeaceae bacterium]|jgi:hypothetical protein|nr:hypothetical protein [Zoogloeaceae bacterium]
MVPADGEIADGDAANGNLAGGESSISHLPETPPAIRKTGIVPGLASLFPQGQDRQCEKRSNMAIHSFLC